MAEQKTPEGADPDTDLTPYAGPVHQTVKDPAGVERIVGPPLGDYKPAQIEATPDQIKAAEERLKKEEERSEARGKAFSEAAEIDPKDTVSGSLGSTGTTSAGTGLAVADPETDTRDNTAFRTTTTTVKRN